MKERSGDATEVSKGGEWDTEGAAGKDKHRWKELISSHWIRISEFYIESKHGQLSSLFPCLFSLVIMHQFSCGSLTSLFLPSLSKDIYIL